MIIGIIGGTGKQGTGIAKRILYNTDYVVYIGSRDQQKGISHAKKLEKQFSGKTIIGGSNHDAVEKADVVIVAVPFDSLEEILINPFKEKLKEKIVIDCINPLKFKKKGVFLFQPDGKSVTEWISEKIDNPKVVAGFKTISSSLLNSMRTIKQDCFVASDSENAKLVVKEMISSILKTRVIDSGPSFTARYLEAMTALAININIRYNSKDAAFKSTL